MQSHRGFGGGIAAILRFIGTHRAIAPSRTGERHAQQLLMPVHRNHSRSGVRLIAGFIIVVAIIERSIAVGETELHVLRVHAFRQVGLIPALGIWSGAFRSGLLDLRHADARYLVIGAVGIRVIDVCHASPRRIGLVVDGEPLVVDAAWIDGVVVPRGHLISARGFSVLVRAHVRSHCATCRNLHGDCTAGNRQLLRTASRGVHIAILAVRQRGLERRGDIR